MMRAKTAALVGTVNAQSGSTRIYLRPDGFD